MCSRIVSILKNATAGAKASYIQDQQNKNKVQLKPKSKKIKSIQDKYKYITNAIIGTTLVIMTLTVICSCVMYYMVMETNTIRQHELEKESKLMSNLILYTKSELEAKSTVVLKEISKNITEEIYNTLDMDKLHTNMNNGIYPRELTDIFRKNISGVCTIPGMDAEKNNIFICNADGIIVDYSLGHASQFESRTWQYEFNKSFNPEMYKATIENIMDKNISNLFIEEIGSTNKVIDTKTVLSEKDLIDIFKKNGLEGLKHFNFFIPVYVLDNNDIFGTFDITDGIKVKNNKFIIIQRYNLYDYIYTYNLNENYKITSPANFERLNTVIYLYIIVNILSVLGVIGYVLNSINAVGHKHVDDIYHNITSDAKIKNVPINKEELSIEKAIVKKHKSDKYAVDFIAALSRDERLMNYNDSSDK